MFAVLSTPVRLRTNSELWQLEKCEVTTVQHRFDTAQHVQHLNTMCRSGIFSQRCQGAQMFIGSWIRRW